MSTFVINPLKNGKLLSWNANNKQWYRTVPVFANGNFANKRRYFGTGQGRSDDKSYRKARNKLVDHLETMNAIKKDIDALSDTAPRAAAFRKRIERGERGSTRLEHWLRDNRPGYLEGSSGEKGIKATQYSPDDVVDDLTRLLAEEALGRLALRGVLNQPASSPPAPDKPTIVDVSGSWLKAEHQRFDSGELGPSGYDSKRKGIKTFVQWCDGKRFGDALHVESMMSDYRTYLLGLVRDGTYEHNTFNDKVKFLGQFMRWAYRNRYIEELPRNLPDIVKQLATKKEGKPLSLDQVRSIWQAADSRMKCFIALGLNCGFKNTDITVLRARDVKGNRLLRPRSKTSIEMNYELWPVTVQLLQLTREDSGKSQNDNFFQGSRGGEMKPASVGTMFKTVAKRAGVVVGTTKAGNTAYATFEQLRDTSADHIKKSIKN